MRLGLALLLSACGAPLYHAPAANVPLLAGPGDVRLGASFGTNGADVQAAVGLPANVGLMASISAKGSRGDRHFHGYGEGAAGFWGTEERHRFEIYLGYGRGDASAHGEVGLPGITRSDIYSAAADYQRVFVQGAWGYARKHTEAGFALRVAHLDFRLVEGSAKESYDSSEEGFATVDLARRQKYFTTEPVAFWRVGHENLKFEVQAGLVLKSGEPDPRPWPLHFSFGVRGAFGGPEEETGPAAP